MIVVKSSHFDVPMQAIWLQLLFRIFQFQHVLFYIVAVAFDNLNYRNEMNENEYYTNTALLWGWMYDNHIKGQCVCCC